jgi:hypothetical protein
MHYQFIIVRNKDIEADAVRGELEVMLKARYDSKTHALFYSDDMNKKIKT